MDYRAIPHFKMVDLLTNGHIGICLEARGLATDVTAGSDRKPAACLHPGVFGPTPRKGGIRPEATGHRTGEAVIWASPPLINYRTLRQCSFELLNRFITNLRVGELQLIELRQIGQWRQVADLRFVEV